MAKTAAMYVTHVKFGDECGCAPGMGVSVGAKVEVGSEVGVGGFRLSIGH